MHFFYMDESGDTGTDLSNIEQPIFVLGGISIRDEGWNKTHDDWQKAISDYFNKKIPSNFELHSYELLSPKGEGPFKDHPIEKRLALAQKAIDLIVERKHGVHYIAFDKARISSNGCSSNLSYNYKIPYLLGFDYLITYINEFVKTELGRSARGMVILDQKKEHMPTVEKIFHERRFLGTKTHRIKSIVEFASAVDSIKNPMVQLSDLVIIAFGVFSKLKKDIKTHRKLLKIFMQIVITLFIHAKRKNH